MAATIFTAISALRMILETETDAESPDNETTYAGMRVAIETLYMLLFSTGFSGTVTGISTTTITHAESAQTPDVHNGRTTLITSGSARGNFYTIDDCAAQSLIHTGDDPESDGVLVGDTFLVLYDLKTNLDGHDHDTINAKGIVLGNDTVDSQHYAADSIDAEHYAPASVDQTAIGASAVGQGELKTATEEHSGSTQTFTFTSAVSYGFFPQFKHVGGGTSAFNLPQAMSSASYVTAIDCVSAVSAYAQIRYVQASGELHWIFVLMKDGKPFGTRQAPDHPRYGSPGTDHPFPLSYDPKEHEIIVVNPSMIDVERIQARMIPSADGGYMTREKSILGMEQDYDRPYRSFIDVFNEMFEIEESKEADWPDIPITIDLPRIHEGRIVDDWRFMPREKYNPETGLFEAVKVEPVKRVIAKPDYITALSIKERSKKL